MALFGAPNVEKLFVREDFEGLRKALSYRRDTDERDAEEVRSKAASWISGMLLVPAELLNELVTALGDRSTRVGREAARTIEKLSQDPHMARDLSKFASELQEAAQRRWKDFSPEEHTLLRLTIIRLVSLGSHVALKLTDFLRAGIRDTNSEVRLFVLQAARTAGDRLAVPSLIDALRDRDSRVREEAASALTTAQDARALEALVVALSDSEAGVRKHAAIALREIADVRVLEPLVDRLEDTNQDVRWAAARTLRRLKWQPTSDARRLRYSLLSVERGDDATVAEALEELGTLNMPQAREALIACLAHARATVRKTAATVLGHQQDPGSVGALLRAFSEDKDTSVRIAAAEALGNIADVLAADPRTLAPSSDKNSSLP